MQDNYSQIDRQIGTLFDEINHKDYTEDQVILIKDINNCFLSLWKISIENPNSDFSKFFLIFVYNLFDLGLEHIAEAMLKVVDPTYYGQTFLNDMRSAEKNWQCFEELKNKVDDSSKAMSEHHKQEAEFLFVAWSLISKLKNYKAFPGSINFMNFLKLLEGEVFKIKIKPKIGIHTDNVNGNADTKIRANDDSDAFIFASEDDNKVKEKATVSKVKETTEKKEDFLVLIDDEPTRNSENPTTIL